MSVPFHALFTATVDSSNSSEEGEHITSFACYSNKDIVNLLSDLKALQLWPFHPITKYMGFVHIDGFFLRATF